MKGMVLGLTQEFAVMEWTGPIAGDGCCEGRPEPVFVWMREG